MRKLKTIKTIFLAFFLFAINSSFAAEGYYFCGGGYYEGSSYFNLFQQENIPQKAFYPFLKTYDVAFYDGVEPYQSENIRLWYHYFNKKYSKKSLAQLIFNDKVNDFSKDFKQGAKETQFVKYIQFAKDCESIAVERSGSWDYKEILNSKEGNVSELLENGLKLFEKEKDTDLKLRYAYQIIRLYHYSKMHYEAIDFFEDSIQSEYPKNEIYYYLLDQLGGCYYNIQQYERAAYTFLTVFDKSLDRKASAFTSYKFCTYKGAEGKTLLKTQEERANQIFITGLRQFSDELQDLQRIRDIGVAEDKQELLLMRIINGLEREALPQYSSGEKSIMAFKRDTKEKIIDVLSFVDEVIEENPKNQGFWKLTSSYLSFLSGNIDTAKTKLTGVTSNTLSQQKESLKVIYNVFSWNGISAENEKWLANVFKHLKSEKALDVSHCEEFSENTYSCNIRAFTFKQLSHYYFQQDELAKAFLLQNPYRYLDNIKGISSHKLVDQLIDLLEKPNKNSFEELLLKERSGANKTTIINVLKNEKGNIYMRSGDFKNAIHFLDKHEYKDILPEIFSNNTKECFTCEVDDVMEDAVYQAELFSFLNKEMNTYTLTTNLNRLAEITDNNEEKEWKRKLANYLLANYFFNVSNTGYFKSVNYSIESWGPYGFGQERVSQKLIDEQKDNFYFNTNTNLYNNLASKSKEYYKKTIALSSDKELNARCSYMIAKCELNYFYNNDWTTSYGLYDVDETEEPTREGFDALKNNYSNTKFYEEIKSRCGFFKHYDAQ